MRLDPRLDASATRPPPHKKGSIHLSTTRQGFKAMTGSLVATKAGARTPIYLLRTIGRDVTADRCGRLNEIPARSGGVEIVPCRDANDGEILPLGRFDQVPLASSVGRMGAALAGAVGPGSIGGGERPEV